MPNWKELGKFHIDQIGAGSECHGVGVSIHIYRCAVASIKPRQPTRRQYNRFSRDSYRRLVLYVPADRADDNPVINNNIVDRKPANPHNAVGTRHLRTQAFRHRRASVQKINIDAAGYAVTRCHYASNFTVFPRPADLPIVHFMDPINRFSAQDA